MRENEGRGITDDSRGDENGDGDAVLLSPSLFASKSDEDVRASLLASASMLYAAFAADMRSFSLVSDDFIPFFPRVFGDGGKYGRETAGWIGFVWRMGFDLLIGVIIDQAKQMLRGAVTGSAPESLHSTT